LQEILGITGKIVLSVVLSGIIGAEREVRHKGAGLRTHILVAVGSTLIVLTSFHISDIYKNVNADPTRIISCIITGIGFLCAGTIIRGGEQVVGLTTAATLWIVAAVGIAVGCSYYTAAIVTTAIVFIVLSCFRPIEGQLTKHFNHYNI